MAGFNTAVTGLKSASTMLDVAGNNIANSSTTGFKSSRTEFADIYASSVVGAGSSNTPGSGVTVSDISQDFSAGTIEFTNNNLDLAINGSGFFQLDDGNGTVTYTRAGSFELDKNGNIVSKSGKYLQGYGLDTDGNVLPLQNLAVSAKESAPKATESMELSFNINSAEDAEELQRTFDKDEPGSYTYSTTIETVDSLGFSNSIRTYFVEQAAKREVYQYNIGASQEVNISGVAINFAAAAADLAAALSELENADPRIDTSTLSPLGPDGSGDYILRFELKASSTQLGNVVVTDVANAEIDLDIGFPRERDANEIQTIELADNNTLNPTNNLVQYPVKLAIGGVEIEIGQPASASNDYEASVGAALESYSSQIIDKNPDIESFVYNSVSNSIEITWKAEAGNADPLSISQLNNIANTVLADPARTEAFELQKGDNSFLGTYRMYAYLNNTEALDIGKRLDPPGSQTVTEVGPIVINFDPTTGFLAGINGESVPAGGAAPSITITNADPTNPDTEIDLDITGTTQFAAVSIVKNATQDGYPKGDLIGVSFAESGEMVAAFSNGQRQNLGLVAMASFENQDGLQPAGNTEWIATLNSGNAILNPPGAGLNGTLRSAALESSNVDLSAELVKLIEGQRNFQANSKTLETMNTVTQAILQI